jgi:hypothetical protein
MLKVGGCVESRTLSEMGDGRWMLHGMPWHYCAERGGLGNENIWAERM